MVMWDKGGYCVGLSHPGDLVRQMVSKNVLSHVKRS